MDRLDSIWIRRMRAIAVAAALLVTPIVMPYSASAQNGSRPAAPTVLAGAGIVGTLGTESAELPVYAGSPECGLFESGTSGGLSLDGRLVLPSFFGGAVGLDARLRVGYVASRLTATPPTPTTVRDADGGGLVELDREFRLDRSTVAATVDLLARLQTGRLVVGAGGALGARITSTFEQSDNILGPGAQSFSDGQTSRAMSAQANESSALVIAPMLTAGYAIPIAERTALVPELTVRLDVLSSVREGAWRSTEVGFGVALLVDLTAAASPIDAGGR